MIAAEPAPCLEGVIPPSSEIRELLAVRVTEAELLRAQLRVALRREREAERLAVALRRGVDSHVP
jgi:hypothetical protein